MVVKCSNILQTIIDTKDTSLEIISEIDDVINGKAAESDMI